jgi:hypothetical protein
MYVNFCVERRESCILFFMDYLMTLSAGGLYSVELQDCRAMMNVIISVWKGSWPNQGPIPYFAFQDWGKQGGDSVRITIFLGPDSNRALSGYESRMLPLSEPARCGYVWHHFCNETCSHCTPSLHPSSVKFVRLSARVKAFGMFSHIGYICTHFFNIQKLCVLHKEFTYGQKEGEVVPVLN